MCLWSFRTSESQCCGVPSAHLPSSWWRPSVQTLQAEGLHPPFWLDSTYRRSFPQWEWHTRSWSPHRSEVRFSNSSGIAWRDRGVIWGGTSDQEPSCQCRRHKRLKFDPWFGKIPWSRKRQPTPVFLPGKSMDRRVWWATVNGAAKSRMWLNACTHTHTHTQSSANSIMLKIELNNLKRWSFGDEKAIWMVCREN